MRYFCKVNSAITEFQPARELNPFVELYWSGDFNQGALDGLSQRVIPNGQLELIIHLTDDHCELYRNDGWSPSPDYTIIGMYTSPYDVQFRSNVKVFGIRFKPEGVYNIFGIPASEFMEGFEDMSLVLGSEFRFFCDQLREQETTGDRITITEAYLFNNIRRLKKGVSYVNTAADLIRKNNGRLKINELLDNVYISQRQLEREFKKKIGISPKRYMRITRLNEVNRLLLADENINFTELAYELGYSDQAHFIHDFKSLTGEKPTLLMKERERFIINA